MLLLTADTRGYLGPCGCSENMRGGIARAARQVLRRHAEGPLPVLYVDGGDSLFGQRVTSARQAQSAAGREEGPSAGRGHAAHGPAVRAAGELDDARGPGFRHGLRLPELPPGWGEGAAGGAREVGVVQRGQTRPR